MDLKKGDEDKSTNSKMNAKSENNKPPEESQRKEKCQMEMSWLVLLV
jgi:hypothetical protein